VGVQVQIMTVNSIARKSDLRRYKLLHWGAAIPETDEFKIFYMDIISTQNPVIPIRTSQSDLLDFSANGRLFSGE